MKDPVEAEAVMEAVWAQVERVEDPMEAETVKAVRSMLGGEQRLGRQRQLR